MTNLLERLRGGFPSVLAMRDAADEIESLRADCDRWLDQANDRLLDLDKMRLRAERAEEEGSMRLSVEMELAQLHTRIEAAPVVRVRGKTGEFATIVVSHDLVGKRVRLLVEE